MEAPRPFDLLLPDAARAPACLRARRPGRERAVRSPRAHKNKETSLNQTFSFSNSFILSRARARPGKGGRAWCVSPPPLSRRPACARIWAWSCVLHAWVVCVRSNSFALSLFFIKNWRPCWRRGLMREGGFAAGRVPRLQAHARHPTPLSLVSHPSHSPSLSCVCVCVCVCVRVLRV